MNKAELVTVVQNSTDGEISKACAERAVEAVLDGIKSGIKNDQSVQLVGFGTFSVSHRAARMGVNPQTGEKIQIQASNSVKFKPGSALKAIV